MRFLRSSLIVLLSFSSLMALAQENDKETIAPLVSVGGYINLFYGYDFNQPLTTERLPYLYQHNRHASFNLNHAVVSVKLDHERYRANLAFQGGTYVEDNYLLEPDLYKTIF